MNFLSDPSRLIPILFFLGLLPMLTVIGTSFLKLAIVFSTLRNALGIQQIPPNIAIYSLALILTCFIMAPVGFAIHDNLINKPLKWNSPSLFKQIETEIVTPYKSFLTQHTSKQQVTFFADIGKKIWPEKYKKLIPNDSLIIMLPAFTLGQLSEAFKIGFLLYLPFLAIDLIVSNILLALGMMMLSPVTISLPFKLLIFLLVGGWDKLIVELVHSFA